LKETSSSDQLQEKIINIARVAKVVKGGRRFSFSALVVVGDGQSKVGFGVGKANEVPDAIKKAADQAKKNMVSVAQFQGTIPFDVIGKYGSARVIMNPAQKGKGIIAGGSVRAMCELAGLQDIVCKIHGTKNHQNVVRATIDGFNQLITIDDYAAERRGKAIADVLQLKHAPKVKKEK
jgi:small subunit ribosomal protein S5